MKRTGSIGSAVPPALITTRRPSRSLERTAPTTGGRVAGSGLRTGRPATASTTASTISAVSASRPCPTWPDASGPAAGSTIR